MNLSKVGILSLSAMLGIGIFAPTVSATSQADHPEEHQIKVSSLETSLSEKEELIERLHELFPGRYDFLDGQDFHIDEYRYPEWDDEDVERVSLYFQKELGNNKYFYGSLEFIGEDRKLQHFQSEPVDVEGAMYPAKVSQEEAKEIAASFVDRVANGKSYRLREGQGAHYHWRNRTLTEPIEYEFYYEKLQNGVPVSSQGLTVVVLGNGEITRYHSGEHVSSELTFEANKNTLAKEEVLKTMMNTLDVELRYIIEHDYLKDEAKARLTYIPRPYFEGIHAVDGKWLVAQKFVDELPKQLEIKKLDAGVTSEPKPVTKEEVKKMAEALLEKETDNGTLHIESVTEEKMGELETFSVSYSYRTNNGGHGTNFNVNKQNGEIISFYDVSKGYDNQQSVNLSYEEGLEAAVKAIKTFAPHSMNQYSYPIDVHYKSAENGVYSFHFPLIKNGLVVDGSALYVSISAEDGAIVSFNNYPLLVEEWPEVELAVSKEQALEAFKENIDVQLTYQNLYRSEKQHHFYLLYTPKFQDNYAYFDATKGEWTQTNVEVPTPSLPSLEGHWAEDEINYLIDSSILKIEDPESFHPNQKVSKGTALEVLVKSIFYVEEYRYEQNPKQTFDNIDKNHPLYAVVELAVKKNILDANEKTLDLDKEISREELAYWFIRALEFENVAKYQDIYQVPFIDRTKINNDYLGHVALAYAFGIFQGDAKQQFRPQENVTLAQLSVTNFRFAKKAAEFNIQSW
ncbi:S-layer homology domain-containing protein [Bacillus solitudinis]|uniref:S-layer homology domain-containing protein n=1 Tax=Bacillus solitudinis TaxID=2014074 RepID=UPI000C23CAD3|nr:S-layer homology domain-containing protein [Bacillus solitudinis]